MNKCEHNQSIEQFCISEHCQWKQPGGCQQCIKKYHTHYRQQKIISQIQLTQYLKIFTSSESSNKPNCRNIQQGFYTYFNHLKNQITQVIDLMCKTVINFVGAPYLMQNKLFNCYKRVKNKQYRRLNQKDINRFCEVAKTTSSNMIIKQQNKLYKEQLKKFSKLINNLQSVTLSYQDILSQASLMYKHEKSHFQNLSILIKQTLEITDPAISISQFHQKSLQKNKLDRSQRPQKSQFTTLKSFNSHQYEKNKSKQTEINIPSFYSGLLPNKQKQQKPIRTQKSLIGSQFKRQPSISKDQSPHKFGLRDFNQLQKKQNKQTQNLFNLKRPSSLQRNLPPNNKNLIPQIYVGKNNKVKYQFKLDEYDQFFSPQIQKQKIHILDNYTKKNNSGISEIFGTENASTFFTSEESKRTQSLIDGRQKRQLLQKQAEMNLRKEKLIEMMKTYQYSKKISDPVHVEENFINFPTKTYLKDTITKQIMKKDQKQLKNNSVMVNPSINRSQSFQKQMKIKNNLSLVLEDRDFKNMPPMKQRNKSHTETCNGLFNNPLIDQINPINECVSQTYSVESLQEIKQVLLGENMNGFSKLPIVEEEQKPKAMACSRLIIVPTISKFPNDNSSDSPLIKKRTVLVKASPQKTQSKTKQNLPSKISKKQSVTSQQSSQKQEMTESQQRSLTLLIKSIGQKPQQAILSLQDALRQSSNNLSAAEYLSFLYLQGQKPKQALIVCNKILERFEVVNKENEELLINLQTNKAAALNMLGRYSQAIVLLLKCIKINQTDSILKNLADAYYFSSSYQKAINYYEKTIKLSPNYDEAHHNMAVCFYLQQNYQRAKYSLQKAIEISPKNVEYLEFSRHIKERIMQKIK